MSDILETSSVRGSPSPTTQPGRPWHACTAQEVSTHFGVERSSGLSTEEARQRLARFGPNLLSEAQQETVWQVFLEEIREPMILLLLVTGVLYSVWGNLSDALTIVAVILTLVGVEVFNEYRAKHAIASLSKLAEPTAAVCRAGRSVEIPVEAVVPGDVLLLWAGRRIPADALLVEASRLAADESPLTGESLPVEKEAGIAFPEATALADRRNLVFSGTTITRGRGRAIVVATGMATEVGHTANLARTVKAPRTPLQALMHSLTRWLVWLALGVSVLVPLLGLLLSHQPPQQMVLTGLSMAFAVIPEELPIIITMVLALGAYRLAQRHAIIKRLQAVETLGAVTVIATDKTGTLTQNRLEVQQEAPEQQRLRLLELGVLCTSAEEQGSEFSGDPLEMALLRAAREAGLDVQRLRRSAPVQDEFPFDPLRKRMSVVYDQGNTFRVVVKGAPEALLGHCARHLVGEQIQTFSEADRQAAAEVAERMAGAGLRVLAFAEQTIPAPTHVAQDEAEADLLFVGFVGLLDPPRPEVQAAMAACRAAGIRPLMVTGDHPLTAQAIAHQVGLDGNSPLLTGPALDALPDDRLAAVVKDTSIYARTTPDQKLRLVRALQAAGERVAVTGDGINDAPALAAADIGVAMGETGTDVAREAADIVLADDNFTTIVSAVSEGRVLFANLRKGVRYYLACKVALVAATLLPVLLAVPVPFAPIQIILMELFMDLAASATFVSEPTESDLMRQPPRDPKAPFMSRAMVSSIFVSAVGLFAAVSVAYLLTWSTTGDLTRSQTVAFVTWLVGHLFLAINLRSEREPLFRLGLFSNRLMVAWGLATLVFVLVVTLVPGLQGMLKTVSLTAFEWSLLLLVAVLGTFWLEVRKLLLHRNERKGLSGPRK